MLETLYAAGEIVSKLRGVTARQILDLAEKGLITPARETTGAGSPRLYNFQNVFDICLCLAVRGRIPAAAGTATQELIGNILQSVRIATEEARKIKESEPKNISLKKMRKAAGLPFFPKTFEPPPFEILFIAYDNQNNYTFITSSSDRKIGDLLAGSKKYRPQNYCTYIIEVSALWSYLKLMF